MHSLSSSAAAKRLAQPVMACAFVGLLIAGCVTVGPDYREPEIAMPAKWSQDSKVAGNSPVDEDGLAHWWGVFSDPLLGRLIATAQTNNLDLRQAEARLRQAQARRRLARADQMPSLVGTASARRSKTDTAAGTGSGSASYGAGLDASWEIDLFGGNRRALEAADASLQASQEALRDVMVSLLAEVALSYVQYRSNQVRLGIVESNLVAQTENYRIVAWRHEAGLVTRLDFDQARLSVEQTRAELPSLLTALRQSEHQLSLLMGFPPGTLQETLAAAPPLVPAPATALAIGFPVDILRQRPDVRAAERRLAAQTAQVGVAQAARYPNLTLSGSLGLEALSFGDLFSAGARTAQTLLSSAATLFDAGRLRQKVAIETALQEESLAAYEATVMQAIKEVEDALTELANEANRLEALTIAAEAGESAHNLASQQYAAGLVDFLSVLSTQQALLSAQNALSASHAEIASDTIRLYKALGGGWKTVGHNATTTNSSANKREQQ